MSKETPAAKDEDFVTVKAGDDASKWLAEIERSKTHQKTWHRQAEFVIEKFRDEREYDLIGEDREDKRTNILWSNTEVLMSHLCVDLGTPDVKRMFTQAGKKTKIARQAADVLEKTMRVEAEAYDHTHEFEDAIEDKLLPGRGVCWLELEEAEDEDGAMNWFDARIKHVPWDRFLMGQSRRWEDVPWVGQVLLFDRDDLEESFPAYAADIPLTYTEEGYGDKQKHAEEQGYQRAMVYQLWCKRTMQRIYVADGFDKVLQADNDPYRLKGFFPTAKPLYAIKTTNSLNPIPMYIMYQDQAAELDRLTTRAYRLVETLKYCGVYGTIGEGSDSGMPDISKLEDGEFTPVKNYAALKEAGGLAALFMVRDLAPIAAAYQTVMAQRQGLVQTIYDITGISDIQRGSSDPNETFGAQELKARFGSTRSSRRQRMVQRFVRDTYRLKAELIAEHYSREQLEAMTGILMPTKDDQEKAKKALVQLQQAAGLAKQSGQPMPPVDPESVQDIQAIISAIPWEDISKVLRSNTRRMMMVDVETDDTAFVDEEKAKENGVEFMNALFGAMEKAIPAAKAEPVLIPLVKESILFVAGTYKVGQAFEDTITEAFEKLEQQASQPQQPKPTADEAKAQQIQQETQAKLQEKQADAQASQQETQSRLQNDTLERQQAIQEHSMTMQERVQNMQQDQEIHAADMQARAQEAEADREKLSLEVQEARAKLAGAGLRPQPLGM